MLMKPNYIKRNRILLINYVNEFVNEAEDKSRGVSGTLFQRVTSEWLDVYEMLLHVSARRVLQGFTKVCVGAGVKCSQGEVVCF